MTMKWVIFGLREEGEMGMSTRENYDSQPILHTTVYNIPVAIYEEFEAVDYDAARLYFERFMGYVQ